MIKKLKIDLDWKPPKDWLDKYLEYVGLVLSFIDLKPKSISCKDSPGGKGWHVTVELEEAISDMQALRIQFLLGDDRTRCRLNYARIKAGVKGWNKLWSYKIKRI